MFAGEMEKREYVLELFQLCSEERLAGGGEKYAVVALLADLSLPDLGRKEGSGEKSSSHSNAPPMKQSYNFQVLTIRT